MTNPARIKANSNFRVKAYDRLEITVPKGAGPELRRLAAEAGARSLGSYLAGIIERETGIKCTLDGEFPAAKK